jgi:methyl-accepting chemotaxis protein
MYRAQIIGANSVAAIEFNDPHSAENTLSALRAATNITYAGIYINERQPFASYWRDQPGPAPALLAIPTGKEDVSKFGNDQVSLAKTIIFQEKKVGTVYLISDLSAIDERLRRYAIIVIIVLLTSLFAALLISRMSQRVVAEPIVNLAETARAVSRDQNYSVRVAPGGNKDEVSTLIAAFNEMLGQIQQRDSALHQAHDLLEGRVKERTSRTQRLQKSACACFLLACCSSRTKNDAISPVNYTTAPAKSSPL